MMYYGAHTQWWRGRVGGCCCAVSPSHPTGSGAELSHPLGQPRGRGDAHAVPLAPGSSLLPRHTTQPWCGGDAPPGAFWGLGAPPRAERWLCLQHPTPCPGAAHTAWSPARGDPLCLRSRGPPRAPAARISNAARRSPPSSAPLRSHTVHTWVQQRATSRRADVHSCCPSPPARRAAHHRPGTARIAGTPPHTAPHSSTLTPAPLSSEPPPCSQSHIPGPPGAGIQEGEQGARGFAFLDSGSRFCSRLFPWKLASDLGK